MSSATLTTLGFVFLGFLILSLINKTLSKIFGVVGLLLIALIVYQAKTGIVIIDFSNIADFFLGVGLRAAEWTENNLLPSLSELAKVIEGYLE